LEWLRQGKLACPRIVELEGLDRIAEAHDLIQSGKSVGKIIVKLV
jgi:NADPH-dependent curcumin reductase CurA